VFESWTMLIWDGFGTDQSPTSMKSCARALRVICGSTPSCLLQFSSAAVIVQGMSTKAEAILEKVQGLAPAELRELCRQINRLAENSDKPAFKTRHGIPLSRNDGVKMTAEEVAATLSD